VKKACIETFGCQMNVHDSERMAGLLKQAGYEITEEATDADLVVVNTCSVRERAEDKLYSRLGVLSGGDSANRPLIAVTGCVAQQEANNIFRRSGHVDVVVGTQAIRHLPMLVDAAERTSAPQMDVNPYDDVSFPLGLASRNDPVKAFVTVIEGCNDFCSFCVVPYTRGHERMRPAADIIREVERAAEEGHREIQLLGQIVNHYEAPDVPGCDFAGLLAQVNDVRGVERIRFASPHPRHVTAEMIRAMAELPKVCNHLHLPVQSGSTSVLTAMRRRYTREEYLELVGNIRDAIPALALSTDVIVGFPGETDAQFEETLSLVSEVGYQSMFSFKYSERPKTLAANRLPDDVDEKEKSRRLTELQLLQNGIQARLLAEAVGSTQEVLVDSTSRRRAHEVSGRTSRNTVVNFAGSSEWIGRTMNVRILRAGPHSLWGKAEVSHAD